jgi:predicted transcriptional regulator
VARIILTDDLAHLSGIISRGDLQNMLFTPNSRQRYESHKGNAQAHTMSVADKPDEEDKAIKLFMHHNVFHVPAQWSKTKILEELIEAPFNSVVLTDSQEHPVGIVSNRDILEAIASYKPVT